MSKIKNQNNNNKKLSGNPSERSFLHKGEPSSTVGGNADWYSHSGNQYGEPSKTNKQKPKPKDKPTI